MKVVQILLLVSLFCFIDRIACAQLRAGESCKKVCDIPCVVPLCKPIACKQQDGSLSATFGIHGKVTTDFDCGDDRAQGMVILPDGMIIAVGGSNACKGGLTYDFALTRYTSYGVLDTCFGSNGKVLTDFSDMYGIPCRFRSSCDYAFAGALYKSCMHTGKGSGKIVVVGSSNATASRTLAFAVARYMFDGSLDTSFNEGGKVITPIGIAAQAHAVAVQADGKIVVVGSAKKRCGGTDFAVVRYRCNGCLDTTFGLHGTGIVRTDFADNNLKESDDQAYAVIIQPNGKIVVAGFSTSKDGKRHFALARYTPDGHLDTSFGAHHTGKVVTSCGGSDEVIRSLFIQRLHSAGCTGNENNALIAVGYSHGTLSGKGYFALARYKENGCIDNSFGPCGTGVTITRFMGNAQELSNARAYAAAVQQSGDIVVAGMNEGKQKGKRFCSYFALAAYTAQGLLNKDFGVKGKIITAFTQDSDDQAYAVGLQENGSIVAAGFSTVDGTRDFALTRYNAGKRVRKKYIY